MVQEKQRKRQEEASDEEDMTDGKRAHLQLQQFMEQKRNKTYKSTVKKVVAPSSKKQEVPKAQVQQTFMPAPASVGQKAGVFDPYAVFNSVNQGGVYYPAPGFTPGQMPRKPAPQGVPMMPKPAAGPMPQPAAGAMPKPAPAPFVPSAQAFVPTQGYQPDLQPPPGFENQ